MKLVLLQLWSGASPRQRDHPVDEAVRHPVGIQHARHPTTMRMHRRSRSQVRERERERERERLELLGDCRDSQQLSMLCLITIECQKLNDVILSVAANNSDYFQVSRWSLQPNSDLINRAQISIVLLID